MYLKHCISQKFKELVSYAVSRPQEASFQRSLLFILSIIFMPCVSKANGIAHVEFKSGQAG